MRVDIVNMEGYIYKGFQKASFEILNVNNAKEFLKSRYLWFRRKSNVLYKIGCGVRIKERLCYKYFQKTYVLYIF